MEKSDFVEVFEALTGNAPFPWQEAMYALMAEGQFEKLSTCNLPTGLGKTSVLAIWLIALANAPGKAPRRLVYVVNRRTVVDQATNEAEMFRRRLCAPNLDGIEPAQAVHLERLAAALRELSTSPDDKDHTPLAISTLRGGFADNGEWCADPARPAIIVGTVDMIGSRLLFSGYGVGFRSKPLHAGFLGQDALLVHDEAHLEESFQRLLRTIECEQTRSRPPDLFPLRVIALSATSRPPGEVIDDNTCDEFTLTPEESDPPEELPDVPSKPIHHVWRRLTAKKSLRFHLTDAEKGAVAKRIAGIATGYTNQHCTVLVFVRTLDDIRTVQKALEKTKRQVISLTGTMRGKERDELIETAAFKRFGKNAQFDETVYMVCTSAGEVGIDMSGNHLVCDLTAFDSMAQRFGRVNRYGDGDALIDVVFPAEFDEKDEFSKARERTLTLLKQLPELPERQDEPGIRRRNASPKALRDLRVGNALSFRIEDAFSPVPTTVPTTDVLFDAWAMTTIRDKLPGRPPVAPHLHGVAEWEPPETYVGWRNDVKAITGNLLDGYPPEDLLEDYPLKPRELLRDLSGRVFDEIQMLARRNPNEPVWIVDEQVRAIKIID